jgi:hypothetical protein
MGERWQEFYVHPLRKASKKEGMEHGLTSLQDFVTRRTALADSIFDP